MADPTPRIWIVGSTQWPPGTLHHAWEALGHLAPWARVEVVPHGMAPPPEVRGVWVMPAHPASDADVIDPTIAAALQHGIPLLGALAIEGSTGGRDSHDLVGTSRSVWAKTARGVEAQGAGFAVLTETPLVWAGGADPLVTDFVRAVAGSAAAASSAPEAATTTAPGSIAASGQLMPPSPAPHLTPENRGPSRPSSFQALRDAEGEERTYVSLMRGERHRWWRALAALGVFVLSMGIMGCFLSVVWALIDPEVMEGNLAEMDMLAPGTMLINNLLLAALIPATLLATRFGHWRPTGLLWSIAGRIRWRWMLVSHLVTLVIWGAYLVTVTVLGGAEISGRPDHYWWLLAISLITTPLQAAGEEVAFRGGLMQGIGAWISKPWIALLVSTALSTAFFALAHTSMDPWVLLELGSLAACACYLTWRTGGLEAAIAVHVINNLVIIVGLLTIGGLEDAYVTSDTTSTAATAIVGLVANVAMAAILLWVARRLGIAPRGWGAPAVRPAPGSPVERSSGRELTHS